MGRGRNRLQRLSIAAITALNRSLYRLPAARGLRRRLAEERDFSHVELRLERGGAGLHGLRIAFLSDLHAGCFMMERELCEIFERVAATQPDLVCLGGDLVESRAEESLLLGKALALLRPPYGVYAVPGNHEYYADPELRIWRHCLEEHGVTVLLNEGRRIKRAGASIWLAGVDDLSYGDPDLPAALNGCNAEEPIVLLSHHPDFFQEAASVGVDLTLSGHTHGGQITLRGRTPYRHTRLGYWRGHYQREGAQLYVGRGAGTTGIPLRIHAPSEVPLIRLVVDGR
jgi:predicted MPP superfamily phosphohydrolase